MQSMVSRLFGIATKSNNLRARIAYAVEHLSIPQPEFKINVGWARHYEDLFASSFHSISGISELLSTAMTKGYVLLAGRGGGAKTIVVYRLAKHTLSLKAVPIVITLKDWTGQDYHTWEQADSHSAKVDLLLSRFGLVSTRSIDLDEISPDVTRLLLMDGLNEVNSRTGQEIIYALEEYVKFAPNSRVLVTDRMVRRSFINASRWQLSMVCPLDTPEIERQIHARFGNSKRFDLLSTDIRHLLTSPYFLNAFLTDGQLAPTRSEEFKAYFFKHVGFNEQELDLASGAALNVYRSSTRTFSLADFIASSSDTVGQKLKDSGAIIIEDGRAYFEHHLKHDYLVSRYLAQHPAEWTDDIFKVVTFGASSFETITLTLEQIGTVEAADHFLRRVYDWNPYGSGYAIAEARQTLASREMQVVILAMLAERRLDIMLRTAERALDTLNLVRSQYAADFRTATALQQIFTTLNQVESDEQRFREWRDLYTLAPGTQATDEHVAHLTDPDSVIGWTSSNLLKRLSLNNEQLGMVRDLLQNNQDPKVRWRAAHVLGAFPSEANFHALVAALSDAAVSVRFGSTRSLIEIAARDHTLTNHIFQALIENAAQIAPHRSVVEEVQRAVFVRRDRVPPNWKSEVLPLFGVLEARAVSAYEAEQWDRVVKDLVVTYGT
jgi:hypothetical protein